jgi:hypothetical protein
MTIEAMKLALEALENNKQNHYYCEDPWYSCPKHEEGCANEAEGDECNCGADEINAQFDKAITALRQAIEQAEQEPVAWITEKISGPTKGYMTGTFNKDTGRKDARSIPLCEHPPQHQPWVGLTTSELDEIDALIRERGSATIAEIYRAIEAKLKEKNT